MLVDSPPDLPRPLIPFLPELLFGSFYLAEIQNVDLLFSGLILQIPELFILYQELSMQLVLPIRQIVHSRLSLLTALSGLLNLLSEQLSIAMIRPMHRFARHKRFLLLFEHVNEHFVSLIERLPLFFQNLGLFIL